MFDNFLMSLTDRLVLRPTRHPIHTAGKRHVFAYASDQLEVWIQRRGEDAAAEPNLFVLEFPGTASRAERPSAFLDGYWSDARVELWSVNPPGYGGSSGHARLRALSIIAGHALDELQRVAQGRPVVVAGSSLGCISGLYLGANRKVSGLLLQNPPDLRQVILSRGRAWPLRWAAHVVAGQVPVELDGIHNAKRATAAAVFVLAMRDQIVPTAVQQQVYDAYAGPKRILERPNADHDTPLSENDIQRLHEMKVWLHDAVAS